MEHTIDIPLKAIIWVSNKRSISGSYQYIEWRGPEEKNSCSVIHEDQYEEVWKVFEKLGLSHNRKGRFDFHHCWSCFDPKRPSLHPVVESFFAPKDNEEALGHLRTMDELENISSLRVEF